MDNFFLAIALFSISQDTISMRNGTQETCNICAPQMGRPHGGPQKGLARVWLTGGVGLQIDWLDDGGFLLFWPECLTR